MREDTNPYDILGVSRDADESEIEVAYNALFDRYEPAANEGDQEAIAMLERLNEARDTLVDPRQRRAVDARLPAYGVNVRGRRGPAVAGGGATATRPRAAAPATARPRESYSGARIADKPAKRPRSVEPVSKRSTLPLVIGGLLLAIVAVTAVYFISKGPSAGSGTPPGSVVATVNGTPIYMRDYQERLDKDKANALNDPFFAGLADNFQGITGTRMLDVVSFDALDKLINMEVIQQEAKKEKLYPTTDAERKQLIDQAKLNDLNGMSFDQFLKQHNISEEQYNNSVIANTVYAVMASKYMPQGGTDDARTNAFIGWMCDRRKAYDVKINLTFQVQGNKPCSSGLPSDVPLTNSSATPTDQGTPAPQPVETQAAPAPQGAASPAATPVKRATTAPQPVETRAAPAAPQATATPGKP